MDGEGRASGEEAGALERALRVASAAVERAELDRAFVFLKDESARLNSVDPAAGLRVAEALIAASERVDDQHHAAMGRLARADSLRGLGRFLESVPLYEAAAESLDRRGDRVGWARSRIGLTWSLHRIGRSDEALALVPPAREVLARARVWWAVASLSQHAAWISFELGHHAEALRLFEDALDAHRQSDRDGQVLLEDTRVRSAKIEQNVAVVLTTMARFDEALAVLERSTPILEQYGYRLPATRARHNLALVYAGKGLFTRALALYGDALAAFEAAGLDFDAAWVAVGMADCCLRLNRDEDALHLSEEAVARFERCGAVSEAARARVMAALALARLRDDASALEQLDRAAAVFASVGMRGQLAFATLERARRLLDAGQVEASLAAAREAGWQLAACDAPVHAARAAFAEARAALGAGDAAAASRRAAEGIRAADAVGATWLSHEGHHVLARAAAARGDLVEALGRAATAVASIERTDGQLANELRTDFLSDKLDVFEDAIDYALRLGQGEQAFALLERAKSRALVDFLAARSEVEAPSGGGGDPALRARHRRLRQECVWLHGRLHGYGLARRPDLALTAREADRLGAELRQRERELSRLGARLAVAAVGPVGEAAVGELAPPHLAADEVLLEYFFGRDRALCFVVRGGRVDRVVALPGRHELHLLLRRWQLNLASAAQLLAGGRPTGVLRENALLLLGQLHDALIAPVAADLAEARRVVVVPHGPAHWVPFHALHDGRRHLLARLEVATCPSSRVLRHCQRQAGPAGRPVLVVGHSHDGRLPCALREAETVAALLGGECLLEGAATAAAVAARAGGVGVLHLAAHGEARLDSPAFSHIRLADGHLTTADVMGLDLRGALVTLSACDSGRSVVRGGDELIGIARGFLYAGASTLVQSLWRVQDEGAARLVERFYRRLLAGASRGQALRDAQLAALEEGAEHPFLWAPYQLVGEGGRL